MVGAESGPKDCLTSGPTAAPTIAPSMHPCYETNTDYNQNDCPGIGNPIWTDANRGPSDCQQECQATTACACTHWTVTAEHRCYLKMSDSGRRVNIGAIAGPKDCPTTGPSAPPSVRPSILPTILPSILPTHSPSILPTVMPSASPSTGGLEKCPRSYRESSFNGNVGYFGVTNHQMIPGTNDGVTPASWQAYHDLCATKCGATASVSFESGELNSVRDAGQIAMNGGTVIQSGWLVPLICNAPGPNMLATHCNSVSNWEWIDLSTGSHSGPLPAWPDGGANLQQALESMHAQHPALQSACAIVHKNSPHDMTPAPCTISYALLCKSDGTKGPTASPSAGSPPTQSPQSAPTVPGGPPTRSPSSPPMADLGPCPVRYAQHAASPSGLSFGVLNRQLVVGTTDGITANGLKEYRSLCYTTCGAQEVPGFPLDEFTSAKTAVGLAESAKANGGVGVTTGALTAIICRPSPGTQVFPYCGTASHWKIMSMDTGEATDPLSPTTWYDGAVDLNAMVQNLGSTTPTPETLCSIIEAGTHKLVPALCSGSYALLCKVRGSAPTTSPTSPTRSPSRRPSWSCPLRWKQGTSSYVNFGDPKRSWGVANYLKVFGTNEGVAQQKWQEWYNQCNNDCGASGWRMIPGGDFQYARGAVTLAAEPWSQANGGAGLGSGVIAPMYCAPGSGTSISPHCGTFDKWHEVKLLDGTEYNALTAWPDSSVPATDLQNMVQQLSQATPTPTALCAKFEPTGNHRLVPTLCSENLAPLCKISGGAPTFSPSVAPLSPTRAPSLTCPAGIKWRGGSLRRAQDNSHYHFMYAVIELGQGLRMSDESEVIENLCMSCGGNEMPDYDQADVDTVKKTVSDSGYTAGVWLMAMCTHTSTLCSTSHNRDKWFWAGDDNGQQPPTQFPTWAWLANEDPLWIGGTANPCAKFIFHSNDAFGAQAANCADKFPVLCKKKAVVSCPGWHSVANSYPSWMYSVYTRHLASLQQNGPVDFGNKSQWSDQCKECGAMGADSIEFDHTGMDAFKRAAENGNTWLPIYCPSDCQNAHSWKMLNDTTIPTSGGSSNWTWLWGASNAPPSQAATGHPVASPQTSGTGGTTGTGAATTGGATPVPAAASTSAGAGGGLSNTPAPTAHPTMPPTSSPTQSPSRSPTGVPTDSPTPLPRYCAYYGHPSGTTFSTTGRDVHVVYCTQALAYPLCFRYRDSDPPTGSPSMSPTFTPSVSPTHGPTSPTVSPTDSPHPPPSVSPTQVPTNPTVSPSDSPTARPTQPPSAHPTAQPTAAPTGRPTGSPTASPTQTPSTGTPSTPPSSSTPTGSPTASPAPDPSGSPTGTPTASPSTSPPSGAPTAGPTLPPSAAPTGTPSTSPSTSSPSGAPTASPVPSPSAAPTGTPSTSPSTSSPSGAPTASPVPSPSAAPTGTPSASPSTSPTSAHPTGSPTSAPTSSPTVSPLTPTVSPSASPTAAPSTAPTFPPTASPSATPTVAPEDPTVSPTLSPTVSPTGNPSESPSVSPSSAPSGAPSTSTPSVTPSTSPPSASPTRSPTNPTSPPSTSPTGAPSSSPPTLAPSVSPTTATPSESPTTAPTVSPSTSAPTTSPSNIPTNTPTVSPTFPPTNTPSDSPTGAPTGTPTQSPSSAPTQPPSIAPTSTAPTAAPANPTAPPTASPTLSPSTSPTVSPLTTPPSAAPSPIPTVAPLTVAPTGAPSAAVSPSPSANPTVLPSAPPSRTPTAAPSGSPSAVPTGSPSNPGDSSPPSSAPVPPPPPPAPPAPPPPPVAQQQVIATQVVADALTTISQLVAGTSLTTTTTTGTTTTGTTTGTTAGTTTTTTGATTTTTTGTTAAAAPTAAQQSQLAQQAQQVANRIKNAVTSLMSAATVLSVGQQLAITTTEVQVKIEALDPVALATTGITLGRGHAHALAADEHDAGSHRRAHTLSIGGQVPPGALPVGSSSKVVSSVSVWKPVGGVAAAAFIENHTAQVTEGKIEVAKPMGDVIQPRFQVDGQEVSDLQQDMDIETVVASGSAHRRAQALAELLSSACGDAAAVQGATQPYGVDGAGCDAHLEMRWWDEVEMTWRNVDGVVVDPDTGTIKGKTKKVAPLVGFVVSVLPVLNAPDPSLLATMTWPEAAALSPIWGLYVFYLILFTISYFWDERARERAEEKKRLREKTENINTVLQADEGPQTCRKLRIWWQELTRDLRTHNWFSWFFCPPSAPYNRMRRITVLASLWFTVQLFTALLFGNKENAQGVRQFTTPIFTAICLMPTTVSMSLIFKRARPRLGGLFGPGKTVVKEKKNTVADDIREAFEWCDEDGSGELVQEELVLVMMRLGCDRAVAEREAQEIMDIADVDRSGRLDFDEFAGAVLHPSDPSKAVIFRALVLKKDARAPKPGATEPAATPTPDRSGEGSPRALLLPGAGGERRESGRSIAPLQDAAAADYAVAKTRKASIAEQQSSCGQVCPACQAQMLANATPAPQPTESMTCPVCTTQWQSQVVTGVIAPSPTPLDNVQRPWSPTEPAAPSPPWSGSMSDAPFMSPGSLTANAAGLMSHDTASSCRLHSGHMPVEEDPFLSRDSCHAAPVPPSDCRVAEMEQDGEPGSGQEAAPDPLLDQPAVRRSASSSSRPRRQSGVSDASVMSDDEDLDSPRRQERSSRPNLRRATKANVTQSALHLKWWQALVFNSTRMGQRGAGNAPSRYCLGMRWGVGDQAPTPLRTIIRKADPRALSEATPSSRAARRAGSRSGSVGTPRSPTASKRDLPLPVLARAAQDLRTRVDDAGVPLTEEQAARQESAVDGVPLGVAAMADIVHSRRVMLAAILRDSMRRRVVALTMVEQRKATRRRSSAPASARRRVSTLPQRDTHTHVPGCPGQGSVVAGYNECPLCGGLLIIGAEPPSDADLGDGTVATGQAGRLLLEAATLERDWVLGKIFNLWLRRVLARTGLVHCTLVNSITGRCYDVDLHPLLQLGVVAEAFATHAVRSDVGLTKTEQRFRCEHQGLYVALEDYVADIAVHGYRSANGRFKIRISFVDDTMTEVDSDLDVPGDADVQEFFKVDPDSLGGKVRLLPPVLPPWYQRVLQRVRGRWRAALIVTLIVAFFYLANNWPCPCNIGIVIGAWAVLMGLLYCDAPVESLVIIALGLVLGFLALFVFLVANKTFGAFLMLTWVFAVLSVGMSELQHKRPKYKPYTKPVVPYVLGTYWVALCFYFTRIEYGAPWYASVVCISFLPPLFWFCRYKLQREWGRKYLAMLVFVTGAVLALAISLLAIPWSTSEWSERRERQGPPERFEAIVLIVTLWVFGAGVAFAVFKMAGLDMIPEQLGATWALTTFIVAMVAHWAAIFVILSLALEFHREGRLRIYYNAVITAYVQDILFNEPIKVLFLTQFGPVMKTLMKVGAGKVVRYVLVETGIFELWMRLLS
eukprot:TRINITY_DN1038_c0_g1_i9.p1 TRINITY_DN1038_c0_g1~~TRINITY_DN1038_c0_g1_i9.p1  ORF type:complete len:3534 (+),score=621.24 TRINITY_DN1038_c0_g1_i9:396-10604(+)